MVFLWCLRHSFFISAAHIFQLRRWEFSNRCFDCFQTSNGFTTNHFTLLDRSVRTSVRDGRRRRVRKVGTFRRLIFKVIFRFFSFRWRLVARFQSLQAFCKRCLHSILALITSGNVDGWLFQKQILIFISYRLLWFLGSLRWMFFAPKMTKFLGTQARHAATTGMIIIIISSSREEIEKKKW